MVDLKNEKITGKERRAMIIGVLQAILPVAIFICLLYFLAFVIIYVWLYLN